MFLLGDWFERKRSETKDVPAPKRQRNTVQVPKYDDRDLRAFLNIVDVTGRDVTPTGAMGATTDDGLDDVFDLLTELDDAPVA